MAESPTRLTSGAPYPLGAHCDAGGVHFAVYAGGAEQVDLCLFDAAGAAQLRCLPLPECTDGVWHGYLPGARPGQVYGYRAHGPYRPEQGQRYNAHKLLLDPYARRLVGALSWHDALYGFQLRSQSLDLSFDERDSAAYVPKAVVTRDSFEWGEDAPPRTPWRDTVLYEAHLRGLTMRLAGIPPAQRGTAAALAHPLTIAHLQRLGVTAVELLPVHAWIDDRPLVERGKSNYWGYNTLAFFAPEPRLLAGGEPDELKRAIQGLHRAGIEVILDVVYNHSAEGSEVGPTLSLRGLDNAAYYRLHAAEPRRCVNDTGCGNTLNFTHARVIQMTLDSLRYWVQHYHVDGFRFDLCVTLGREKQGFDASAGFFDALLQDPVLAQVKLIAEPWDLGPGGFQLGQHPPGMAEWNASFRDDVRRVWRGDSALRGALAARLEGSADVFDHQQRKPWASINFLTAHDGFTLSDWASYSHKHNEANGEGNCDGTDDNASNNWGVEGPTDDAGIRATRARVQRAMLATLLCSHGTPMLLAGDEFGRTQQGNNNAYCQDNAVSWVDWDLSQSASGAELSRLVSRLTSLRRQYQTLRCDYFQHGRLEPLAQVRDIEWFDERGGTMQQQDWQYTEGRLLCVRRALRLDNARAEVSLMLINSTADSHRFQLPVPSFLYWLRLDTAALGLADIRVEDGTVDVGARSVQLLTAVVTAPSPASFVHAVGDSAIQPQETGTVRVLVPALPEQD